MAPTVRLCCFMRAFILGERSSLGMQPLPSSGLSCAGPHRAEKATRAHLSCEEKKRTFTAHLEIYPLRAESRKTVKKKNCQKPLGGCCRPLHLAPLR